MQCQEMQDVPPSRRTVRAFFYALCCAVVLFFTWTAPDAATASHASTTKVDSYTLTQRSEKYRVKITYPSVGNPVADAELAIWARDQALRFTESVEQIPLPTPVPYELFITYETIAASPHAVSVIFYITTAMGGGAHPEPGLATFIYDTRYGRRLSYADIFLTQDGLLSALSERCRMSLAETLGDKTVPEMLEAGTEPDMANFDLFALTPSGLRIYFPPYQAAPYSEGYLTVSISLDDLTAFKPQLSFWDNK